tara:strand:- start:63 stop:3221 length:3159 start_codon:yes stop_codon:yes gene_type:complete
MGGGYGNMHSYADPILGNLYGPSSYGNALGNFAAGMPSMVNTAGTAAAVASGFGIGGAGLRTFGNIAGLGALPLMAGLPLHLGVAGALGQFKAGAGQQMFAQDAMQRVFGERDAGGRMGFGASRRAAGEFASMFRELSASANMLTDDQELKNLFNKFNDMSLFQTVRDAKEVGTRFKKLAETVRDISRDLGTTLEGTLPMFRQHVQMGFVDPDDIRNSMRASRAIRGVGVGSSEATITGLQMSQSAANFAAGGTRRQGALGATQTLGMVNIALERGLITDEDLMSSTGQIGERGASDLAQQFMQASRNVMTNSSYGKLLSAFLGETKEGKFTGKLDKDALRRLRNVSSEDLMSEASAKIDAGGLSFMTAMESGMGADIASQLGTGDLTQLLDKIFTEEEAHSEEMKELVLKRMTGLRGQTIKQLLKLSKETRDLEGDYMRQLTQRMLRNRLPSLIEERFSVSGQLDRAYRSLIKDPFLRPLQEMGGSLSAQIGQDVDNLMEDFFVGGVGGGLKSLVTGSFGRRRFTPESTVASRQQMVFQSMFDDELDVTSDMLTGDRYDSLNSESQEALDRLMGSRGSGREGEMEKRMSSDAGAAKRFENLINLGLSQGKRGRDLFKFVTSDENLAKIEGLDDFEYTRQNRTMSGGIMGMLTGLEKNKNITDARMLSQIKSLQRSARDKQAVLLSGNTLFDENIEDTLLGTGKDVLGRTLRGMAVGGTTAALTTGGVGTIGGVLIGGAMAGTAALIDDSGEGLFATGDGEFDDGQIKSDFLRSQVINNKANARAILEALSDETFLSNFNLSNEEEKLKMLKGRGIFVNKETLPEINKLVGQIFKEGDGNIKEGLKDIKEVLGKGSDLLKMSMLRDKRERINKLLTGTLSSKLADEKGGKEFVSSLEGVLKGEGAASLFSIDNRDALIERVGGQEGRQIQEFIDIISEDGKMADANVIASTLSSKKGVTERDKKRILQLGEEGNVEELSKLAFQYSTSKIQNLEETSSVKAVARLQGAEEFASLMLDINNQLSSQLSITQNKTVKFTETMDDAVKSIKEQLP